MKIQYLNGGLANQVFQYIFVKFAELTHPESDPWFFDDSFFFVNNIHNGYELQKVFGLKLNLLSQTFDTDVWNEFIKNKRNGISVPQSFKNLGFNMQMIAEFDNYKEHNPFDGVIHRIPGNMFIPEITNINDEFVYYHGYWLHPKWFSSYANIFRKELTFPPITDSYNQDYAALILGSTSAAVHIRRGDYVSLGWDTTPNFYFEKTKDILERYPDAVFFVFSDDIPWCKAHKEELGLNLPHNTVFVEGNIHEQSYRDLQLMSMCRIILSGKSSFSYLAFLLSSHNEYFISEHLK